MVSLLAGQERFEDFAIVPATTRHAGGYPWYCATKSPAISLGINFVVSYLLHAFNGVLHILIHETRGGEAIHY